MTNMLDGINSDGQAKEEKDSVGMAFVVDTGIHPMTIDLAYVDKSTGGALSLNLHLKGDGVLLRQAIYFTSGDAKGNKKTYIDKKSGDVRNLPGYSICNSLTQIIAGKDIDTLATVEKEILRWDFDAGKELRQKTHVIEELMDKQIYIGAIREIQDKRSKNSAGVYAPNGKTKEVNEIDKFFRASDGMTSSEIAAGAPKALFRDKWVKRFGTATINRSSVAVSGATAGAPADGDAPEDDLFK